MHMKSDFICHALDLIDVTATFENGKIIIESDDANRKIPFVDINKHEFGFINVYGTNSIFLSEPKISTQGNKVIIKGKYFIIPSMYEFVRSGALEEKQDFGKWHNEAVQTDAYKEIYDQFKHILQVGGKEKIFSIQATKDSVKPFNTKEMIQGVFIVESNKKLQVLGKA